MNSQVVWRAMVRIYIGYFSGGAALGRWHVEFPIWRDASLSVGFFRVAPTSQAPFFRVVSNPLPDDAENYDEWCNDDEETPMCDAPFDDYEYEDDEDAYWHGDDCTCEDCLLSYDDEEA